MTVLRAVYWQCYEWLTVLRAVQMLRALRLPVGYNGVVVHAGGQLDHTNAACFIVANLVRGEGGPDLSYRVDIYICVCVCRICNTVYALGWPLFFKVCEMFRSPPTRRVQLLRQTRAYVTLQSISMIFRGSPRMRTTTRGSPRPDNGISTDI